MENFKINNNYHERVERKKERYEELAQTMEQRSTAAYTRGILKRQGFKWSPTRGAWVRQLNGNGLWAAKAVMKELSS